MKLFFRNKASGVAYRVIKLDPKDAKDRKVVLQGEHGQFTEPFDPERFRRMGYDLVREDAPDVSSQSDT